MTDAPLLGQPDSLSRALPRPMIVADNAHVNYTVHASGKRVSGNESLISLRSLRGGRDLKTIPALRGVTFTASEGETIGVVGHNGSGKSTLFRAMSGLIPTSEGTILARDRPVLLGVNAALVPELSGENNIKLGLLAMGFSAEEANARVDEIADFAELNEFIYHPMKTYSSGMGARLRFAIASAKAHSILLIDEALAVGDRRFRTKSENRINELRDTAGLVMIVSHSVGSLRDTCDRVLWVHKGELVADGPTDDVIDDYIAWTKKPGAGAVGAASESAPRSKHSPTGVGSDPKPTGAIGQLKNADGGQLVAGASSDALSPRAVTRRENFRRDAVKQRRRNLVLLSLTGAAIILAVAAGAIIGTLATADGLPGSEDSVVEVASPSATPTSLPPTIATFSSNSATAECAAEDDNLEVQLNWEISGAMSVALAIGESATDALSAPTRAGLPLKAAEYVVPFSCAMEATVYTLTAENESGQRVSAPVQISRVLPTEPEEDPEPSTPGAPSRPQAPSQPAPAPEQPSTEPTAPQPSEEPPAPPVITDPSPVEPQEPAPGGEVPPEPGAEPGEGDQPVAP